MSKIEESLETKKKKEYQEGGCGNDKLVKEEGVGQIYILFLPDPPTCLPYYFLCLRLSLIQDSVLSQIIEDFNLQANIDIWIKRLRR